MKNINMKKYIILVSSVVLSFCLIAAVGLWLYLSPKSQPADASKDAINSGTNIPVQQENGTDNNIKPGTETTTGENVIDTSGIIDLKRINALVEVQKYSLLRNGEYNKDKVNKFVDKNIDEFFPSGSTQVCYKTADLNKDGFSEVALMYEISNNSGRYLMISAVRWENGTFIKDIDEVLKVNDYNFENNEILYGDIITGGNLEFIFVQKDLTGIKSSKAKIFIILNKEFSDYYTIDSPCELEVKDYDNDGLLEVYTSLIDSAGVKHLTWKKWNGNGFIDYDSQVETIINDNETTSN